MQTGPFISIVLPVHNEEKNIGVLLAEIASVFENNIRKSYEIITIDDASDDTSIAVAEKFRNEKSCSSCADSFLLPDNIHIFSQPFRSGQSKALMRGMTTAKGALIVTMDADLQHDPSDIPKLLEKMDSYDMICGIRKGRSDGIARLLCSKIANAFRNMITGDSISDSGCTFRIMRKECVAACMPIDGKLFGCEFLFHPLFVRRRGFRVGETVVSHRLRSAGKSNYKLIRGRFLRGIAACIRVRKILSDITQNNR